MVLTLLQGVRQTHNRQLGKPHSSARPVPTTPPPAPSSSWSTLCVYWSRAAPALPAALIVAGAFRSRASLEKWGSFAFSAAGAPFWHTDWYSEGRRSTRLVFHLSLRKTRSIMVSECRQSLIACLIIRKSSDQSLEELLGRFGINESSWFFLFILILLAIRFRIFFLYLKKLTVTLFYKKHSRYAYVIKIITTIWVNNFVKKGELVNYGYDLVTKKFNLIFQEFYIWTYKKVY